MTTSTKHAPSRNGATTLRPLSGWVLAALAAILIAALVGFAPEPTGDIESALPAPAAQQVVEDWRGNSARLERAPE